MTGVGVDWASGYWIGAKYGDEISIEALPSILNVWEEYGEDFDRMLIDIPIGLPDTNTPPEDLVEGKRLCDQEAKQILPPDIRSSVFDTPCREAVESETYEDAREQNSKVIDRGLGSQSWSLIPRIREVDTFLNNDELNVRNRDIEIRESHPEVCFNGLWERAQIDYPFTHRKSLSDGVDQRKRIIKEYSNSLHRIFQELVDEFENAEKYTGWKYRITKSRLDDVLDAMALAITANLPDDNLLSLPRDRLTPPTDRHYLPMEIVSPKY